VDVVQFGLHDYHRLHGAIGWQTPAERWDGTPFTDRAMSRGRAYQLIDAAEHAQTSAFAAFRDEATHHGRSSMPAAFEFAVCETLPAAPDETPATTCSRCVAAR
jgi:hypothetical protein